MTTDSKQINSLLCAVEGVLWEADADMQHCAFISEHVFYILGYQAQHWMQAPGCWQNYIHPLDRDIINSYTALAGQPKGKAVFEYRMIRADGQVIWIRDTVSTFVKDTGQHILQGIMQDNSAAVRMRELERLERDVLRASSDPGLSVKSIIINYLKDLEGLYPPVMCAVHRVRNRHMVDGVSPSLPQQYLDAIAGLPIRDGEGSCGTAAATGKQVIVSDISHDPRWDKYRDIALKYQLVACWSTPVIDASGEPLATLALYYDHVREPSLDELLMMERSTAILRMILENRQKTDQVTEANMLMLQSQDLAHFGNWRWDVQQDVVSWSPALYAIYGLDVQTFKATFAGYQERLHPDDRDRVRLIIEQVFTSRQDVEFEERIIRPNGDLRYLRSWAKLKADPDGQPLEMIGACIDVTDNVRQRREIQEQNRELRDIAWLQSHVIRSPLANVIGLADLIKHIPNKDPETVAMLDQLIASANELDEQVKLICKKSELAIQYVELSTGEQGIA